MTFKQSTGGSKGNGWTNITSKRNSQGGVCPPEEHQGRPWKQRGYVVEADETGEEKKSETLGDLLGYYRL